MYVLVTYDVPAGRTEIFRKILTTYLTWQQNSVFSGDITPSLHKKMLHEISKRAQSEDSFLFVEADNRHNVRVVKRSKSPTNNLLVAEEDQSHIKKSHVF